MPTLLNSFNRKSKERNMPFGNIASHPSIAAHGTLHKDDVIEPFEFEFEGHKLGQKTISTTLPIEVQCNCALAGAKGQASSPLDKMLAALDQAEL